MWSVGQDVDPVREGPRQWAGYLTELRNRGVADVFMVCSDGLKGMTDAIEQVWPQAVHQQCVVHLVRASLRYTNRKDWQKITPALREIYTAPTVAAAEARFEAFAAEFGDQYPAVIRLWRTSWPQFVPFLDYDHEVRKVLYTTNIIESLNARFRQAARRRGHFPTEQTPLANWSRVAAGLTGFGSGGCCHGRQDSMGWSGGDVVAAARGSWGTCGDRAGGAGGVPERDVCLRMRDVLGPLFTDEAFAGLFSGRGRPAESPGMLAIVSVLQFVEGLTDAQAADAVRGRV